MEKIASFQMNHDTLIPGLYLSRTDEDIVTYDIRFIRPNTPPYMEIAAMHTIEHLFATYVRNTPLKDGVIYVGPMGCRTGFYFLVRSTVISHEQAIGMVRDAMAYIAVYEGEIPGAMRMECGNYLEHNLPRAREYAENMASILSQWNQSLLAYPA